jgi:hypothetical protein
VVLERVVDAARLRDVKLLCHCRRSLKTFALCGDKPESNPHSKTKGCHSERSEAQ